MNKYSILRTGLNICQTSCMSSALTESVTKETWIGFHTSDLLGQAELSTFEPLVEKLLFLLFILPQAEKNEAYRTTGKSNITAGL